MKIEISNSIEELEDTDEEISQKTEQKNYTENERER